MIKLNIGRRRSPWITWADPKSSDRYPLREKQSEIRHRSKRGDNNVTRKAEMETVWPQTRAHPQPPAAGRHKEWTLPWSPCRHLDSKPLDSRTMREYLSARSHPACGHLSQHPQETEGWSFVCCFGQVTPVSKRLLVHSRCFISVRSTEAYRRAREAVLPGGPGFKSWLCHTSPGTPEAHFLQPQFPVPHGGRAGT